MRRIEAQMGLTYAALPLAGFIVIFIFVFVMFRLRGKAGDKEDQENYNRDYEELTALIVVLKKQIERHEYPMIFSGKKQPQIQASAETIRQDGTYVRTTVNGTVTVGHLRGGMWECIAELDDFVWVREW